MSNYNQIIDEDIYAFIPSDVDFKTDVRNACLLSGLTEELSRENPKRNENISQWFQILEDAKLDFDQEEKDKFDYLIMKTLFDILPLIPANRLNHVKGMVADNMEMSRLRNIKQMMANTTGQNIQDIKLDSNDTMFWNESSKVRKTIREVKGRALPMNEFLSGLALYPELYLVELEFEDGPYINIIHKLVITSLKPEKRQLFYDRYGC